MRNFVESIKIRTNKNQKTGNSILLQKAFHHKADQVQIYRRLIQFGFLFVVLAIGFQFVMFVDQLEAGGPVTVSRPSGVEAFLPISALISLKYLLFFFFIWAVFMQMNVRTLEKFIYSPYNMVADIKML